MPCTHLALVSRPRRVSQVFRHLGKHLALIAAAGVLGNGAKPPPTFQAARLLLPLVSLAGFFSFLDRSSVH